MKIEKKFNVGDEVITPPNLYNETEGVVIEVDKLFKATYPWYPAKIDPEGLVRMERDIKCIKIPYEFDGETLTVHYPEDGRSKGYSQVSKFCGYACSVSSKKMCSIFNQDSLQLK